MEFHPTISDVASLKIPDDLTVPQFMFDAAHELRPQKQEDVPANGLRIKYGVGEDDVVVLVSRNHVDYPVAVWAVQNLGGIVSGANPDFTANEIEYQIREIKAVAVFADPDCLPAALAAARKAGLSPDRVLLFDVPEKITEEMYKAYDSVSRLLEYGLGQKPQYTPRRLAPGESKTKLALYSFSSGTMGRPKASAVAIPHYAVIANVLQIAAHSQINDGRLSLQEKRYRAGDIAIGVLPLYHIYMIVNLHFLLFAQISLVVVPKFQFEEMLKSIVTHHINHLMLVPPQIVLLCKHPAVKQHDIRPYIRSIMSSAAPLSAEVNQQIFNLLPDAHIGQAYGMTETCTAVTIWPITRKRGVSGSSGVLVPGTVAKVLKLDGTWAGYNEAGELLVQTPSAALCYSNDAQATKETFLDGWVRTGDEVKFREDGEMFVLDRLKEIMKVKGFQVAPAELEGCLLDHPDVNNACVVGIPDGYTGESPLAFVVLSTDAANRAASGSAEEIKRSIIQHVAKNKIHYKHLTGGVEFVKVIPVSPSGKLLRRVLREQAKMLKRTKPKL
ncbi:amp dependent CoA ligase [Crepidotus variabilis]|uniref:Amp dependent CoA ligase n=1 Tax=Crepidotus variabilis TaxID=179855 RepID=A0A9P6E7G8_9AGAR|nr:amp dependent CoA ligase [Crepidotus variabilis]